MNVTAVYNLKGGVGKTSTAVNLAHLSAGSGRRTLLWDLDAQGAATYLFRIAATVPKRRRVVRGQAPLAAAIKATDYELLDLIPADFAYRHIDLLLDSTSRPTRQLRRLLTQVRKDYDEVLLDCPPGMSLLSENILHAADTVLVPLIPTPLSVRAVEQLSLVLAEADPRPRTLAFFSMADRRKRLHREVIESLDTQRMDTQRIDVAKTLVPTSTLVEQMAERREPVTAFAPNSAVGRCYRALWAELASGRSLGP